MQISAMADLLTFVLNIFVNNGILGVSKVFIKDWHIKTHHVCIYLFTHLCKNFTFCQV